MSYKPDKFSAPGVIIPDDFLTILDGAEYICKNKRDGCCKLQAYQISDADSDCWALKPVPKADEDLTDEQAAAIAGGTLTSCLWWVRTYNWRVNELACGGFISKDTMFRCTNAAHCKIMKPEDSKFLPLVGNVDPWESTNMPVVESKPTDSNNCYAGWTQGKVYPPGSTICDGTVYMCMAELLCSKTSPGATTDIETIWLLKGDEIAMPASQVIEVDYYKRDYQYANGEMAVSEHDMRTYKCIDTSETASGCWNDAPFANPLWQMVTFKPPIDPEWTIFDDFNEVYRYIVGDYIAKIDENTVYMCFDETYCHLDPLAPFGDNGWGLTFYASPKKENLSTPTFRYFTGEH